MAREIIVKIIMYFIIILTLSNCQVGQYYTAKPLKKGEKQILVGLESMDLPGSIRALTKGDKYDRKEVLLYSIPMYPTLHYTVGTKRNMDYSFELSLSGQFSYAMKYKILESEVRRYAMAVRPQIGLGLLPQNISRGISDLEASVWLKIPIIFTKEFGEKSSITGNVGYTFGFPGSSFAPQHTQNAFLFGSTSYHIGKKNKFFISLSFQNLKTTTNNNLRFANTSTQLAIGYIWKFGKIKD